MLLYKLTIVNNNIRTIGLTQAFLYNLLLRKNSHIYLLLIIFDISPENNTSFILN